MSSLQKTTKLLPLKTLKPTVNRQSYGSVWSLLAAKWRLFVNGSERPLPPLHPMHPDTILEDLYKEGQHLVPYEMRRHLKQDWMHRKSRDKHIENNKLYRNLDKQIKSGVYDNWDYANRDERNHQMKDSSKVKQLVNILKWFHKINEWLTK